MNEQKILTSVLRKELAGISKTLQDFFETQRRQTIHQKGDPGKNGYTPKKGKDYVDGVTPVKGKDYFTDEEVEQIVRQVNSLIKTPQKNVDYFTNEDRTELIRAVVKNVKLKDEFYTKTQVDKVVASLIRDIAKKSTLTIKEVIKEVGTSVLDEPEKIARALEKLKGKKRLDAKAIKNLPIPVTYVYNTVSGSGVGTSVSVTDLSSQCDGLTTNFLMPAYSAILMVIITGWSPNGVLRPTVDFTTPDATHITLTSQIGTPVAGTTLIALYVPA